MVIWVSMILCAPRRDMKIKLKGEYELFVIPNDVGISAELRIFRVHEPLSTAVLKKVLKKGMVVIDIGSNIGYNVVLESKVVGSGGKVVAVEPDPTNFSYLLRNIKLNGLTNVVTINKAISDRNGTIKMIKSNRSNWSRVLQNTKDLTSSDMKSIIEVQSVTLASLIRQLKLRKVDLIRMDVEGYEYHIIRASEDTIRRYLPDILVEFHQFIIGKERLTDLLRSLHDSGYIIRCVIPRNIDFALLCRNDYVSVKDISKLIQTQSFDAFSAYATACPKRESLLIEPALS